MFKRPKAASDSAPNGHGTGTFVYLDSDCRKTTYTGDMSVEWVFDSGGWCYYVRTKVNKSIPSWVIDEIDFTTFYEVGEPGGCHSTP